jgi:hypothetical protein
MIEASALVDLSRAGSIDEQIMKLLSSVSHVQIARLNMT